MILLTGATGFVGSALMRRLTRNGETDVLAAVRRVESRIPDSVRCVEVGDILPDTEWRHALPAVKVVIHTAARVHVMKDTAVDPLAEYRRINVDGTLNLARQAAEMGVSRFIFISSIKVNGESTCAERPFRADDAPGPSDAYGVSKMEAEHGLREIANRTAMEVVIIRPPLVYGPGVKANFRSMMHWLRKGVPLPLGAVNNQRSFVALDNLVDLIARCIDHPAAANETFLVSDGEDLSTSQLLRRLGDALGRHARLLRVAPPLLKLFARLAGRPDIASRLCDSLQVDITKTTTKLGWRPPVTVDQGLRKTAYEFLRETPV
jgi:nucleoside-diphosphate-sugar epimerase